MASDFQEAFNTALDELEVRAKKVGLTLTSICRETGVSRATPDRWRKEPPTTVKLLKQMQDVVARAEAQAQSLKIDGISQQLATGADGTMKEPTGLHVAQ